MVASLEQQLAASVELLEKRNKQMSNLAVVPSQYMALTVAAPLQFTEEQEAMIRATYSTGATKEEFAVLMEVAKARRLNPLLRQVHFVKRYDSKAKREVWAVQVSIDGLRAIAERTRLYDGQDEPEYEYTKDGLVKLARVRVYKKGIPRPFVGVARWEEYVQKTREGAPTKFWSDMPFTMLAKCAEALAIRKAFPEDSSGLYVPEEMAQADSDRPQLPRINPHGEDHDPNTGELYETSDPPELMGSLVTAQTKLDNGDWRGARKIIGAKGGPRTEFSGPFSDAKNAGKLTADYSRALGRLWGQLDRRIAKHETQELTDAMNEPEPREPGDDSEPEEP